MIHILKGKKRVCCSLLSDCGVCLTCYSLLLKMTMHSHVNCNFFREFETLRGSYAWSRRDYITICYNMEIQSIDICLQGLICHLQFAFHVTHYAHCRSVSTPTVHRFALQVLHSSRWITRKYLYYQHEDLWCTLSHSYTKLFRHVSYDLWCTLTALTQYTAIS